MDLNAQNDQQKVKPKQMVNPKITLVAMCGFGTVILSLIISIIVVLATRSNSDINSMPSLELAESVCIKRGGKFVDGSESLYGGYLPADDFLNDKVCEKFTSNGNMAYPNNIAIASEDFFYEIGSLKENEKDDYKTEMIKSVVNSEGHEDVTKYAVLENSDDLFKACSSVAGLMTTCQAFYGDIFVMISGQNYTIIDDLFAELGFPKRATLASYIENSGNKTSNLNNGETSNFENNKISESSTEEEIAPSVELTESVCDDYEGEFTSEIPAGNNKRREYAKGKYYCQGADFHFEMAFLQDDGMDSYFESMKTLAESDNYTVLNDAEDFYAAYSNYGGNYHYYIAIYKDAVVNIMAEKASTAKKLFAELGFPSGGNSDSSAE